MLGPDNLREAVQRFLNTLGAALGHRAELASIELAQERRRLLVLLGWFLATAFLTMMAAVFITFVVVFVLWEDFHHEVLFAVAGLYAGAAIFSIFRLRRMIRNLPPILEDTLHELAEDRRCIFSEKSSTESEKQS